ncbi:hypothetical protein LUCX_304 [Xanthomonas phage vB_XciM_LucasX]|nr:hypothetical protein LUCX_304 [Xanthomonas phage vB_XciM_LucasX]
MKLDEALALAGEHPLSTYAWGVGAVILFNSLVAKDQQIDVNHSGQQAHDKLRRLPSSTLAAILVREVQIEGSNIEFLPTVGEQSQGRPPTIPSGRKANPVITLVMVVLAAVSIGLVISNYRTGSDAQKAATADVLKVVVQTMGELAKESNDTAKQNTDAPQQ